MVIWRSFIYMCSRKKMSVDLMDRTEALVEVHLIQKVQRCPMSWEIDVCGHQPLPSTTRNLLIVEISCCNFHRSRSKQGETGKRKRKPDRKRHKECHGHELISYVFITVNEANDPNLLILSKTLHWETSTRCRVKFLVLWFFGFMMFFPVDFECY